MKSDNFDCWVWGIIYTIMTIFLCFTHPIIGGIMVGLPVLALIVVALLSLDGILY